MWLAGFLELYGEAYRRVTGRVQEYAKLEQELRSLATTKSARIEPQQLRLIEDAECRFWVYPRWWPNASGLLTGNIEMPTDLHTLHGKERAVEGLYAPLRHIEVVSVILRFTYPEEFGIISPPVISLLNLIPARSETHVKHYLRYLGVLADLANRYGRYQASLRSLARVDMGLWAAAHLSTDPGCAALAEGMYTDEFFQEIRLRNLAEGFGSHWSRTDAQRLILARVLLKHDFILAALIASRTFESVVYEIVSRAEIQVLQCDPNDDSLKSLISSIKAEPSLLNALGVLPYELDRWRRCRNDTVHPKTARTAMTLERTEGFARGVQKLYDNLPKLK